MLGKLICVLTVVPSDWINFLFGFSLSANSDLWSFAERFFYNTLTYINHLWNYELIKVDGNPLELSQIVKALALFGAGYLVSKWIAWRASKKVLQRFRIPRGVEAAIQTISFYTLLVFFALIALHIVHIPLTMFTVLGGGLAIGLGFGSQNIMNNFISGLILLVEQPIRVGDIVEFQGMVGTIQRIGARSAVVSTPDNLEVIVPNSALLENNVTNWTLGNNQVRRSVTVGVAYGSPTRKVEEILKQIAKENEIILGYPEPQVYFSDFGDSSLVFLLRFWILMNEFGDAIRVESELRHRIDEAFRAEGIVIAFPQRDVHLDFPQGPVRVSLEKSEELA